MSLFLELKRGLAMAAWLDSKTLESFLKTFSPEAQSIALATRKVIHSIFPEAMETAEGKELGYGFDRGYKGLVFAISMKKSGINLGVAGGAALDDPRGLLQGSGKVHRHIEILDAAALKEASLLSLLRRALAIRRHEFLSRVK
jgi:hypothetical protein